MGRIFPTKKLSQWFSPTSSSPRQERLSRTTSFSTSLSSVTLQHQQSTPQSSQLNISSWTTPTSTSQPGAQSPPCLTWLPALTASPTQRSTQHGRPTRSSALSSGGTLDSPWPASLSSPSFCSQTFRSVFTSCASLASPSQASLASSTSGMSPSTSSPASTLFWPLASVSTTRFTSDLLSWWPGVETG